VNPALYALAINTPAAFHDITTGSNDVPCTSGSPDCPGNGIMGYFADTGYDQATGLGSVDASALVNGWPLDYSLVVSPNSVTINAPGDHGTAVINLNSIYNFTGTVTLACTPQSGVTGLTCSISPTTVSASSPTATLTVNTVGAGSASIVKPEHHMDWLMGSGATFFAGIFLAQIPVARRRRIGIQTFFLLALLSVLIGCASSGSSSGGGGNPPNTPPGNYTVKITATSGSTTFTTTVSTQVQ
jgi:hypothetical protein